MNDQPRRGDTAFDFQPVEHRRLRVVEDRPGGRPQWTLDVTVSHHPSFQHQIRAMVLGRTGGWHTVGTWYWTGLGVPSEIVADCQARIAAVVAEHLITRYGERLSMDEFWNRKEANP